MKRVLVIIAALTVAACNDPVTEAEKQYDMARRVGSPADQCQTHRALQAAYLKAGRETDYGLAGVEADQECEVAARGLAGTV